MSDTAIFLFGVVVFGIVLTSTLIGFLRPAYGSQSAKAENSSSPSVPTGAGTPVTAPAISPGLNVNGHQLPESAPVLRRFSQTG